jgi:hypothetical protein
VYSTEQYNKIWEEIYKYNHITLIFDCKINYLTSAKEQICYEYRAEILHKPMRKTIGDEERITIDARISIIKDGYRLLDKNTQSNDTQDSVSRNLQDYISGTDRFDYKWKKVGEAQMKGYMAAGSQYSPNVTTEVKQSTLNITNDEKVECISNPK